MPFLIDCPRCKSPLSVPGKKAGSYVICPQCKGRLWVPKELEQEAAGSASAAPPAGPPLARPPGVSSPGDRGAGPPLPANPLVPSPPPVPAPARPRKVARFISAEAAQSSLKLAEDGKLPELRLLEAGEAAAKESGPRRSNPLVLFGVLSLSAVVCLVLVLLPAETSPSANTREKQRAREMIEKEYFAEMDQLPHYSYQFLLREAQRAHLRGDYKLERELYRKVLGLLRAERKPEKGVTGSPNRDRDLEQYLTILLSG